MKLIFVKIEVHLKIKNYTLNKVKENYLITYLKYPFLQNSSMIFSRVHSVIKLSVNEMLTTEKGHKKASSGFQLMM